MYVHTREFFMPCCLLKKSKLTFSKNLSETQSIRMSNGLDPDKDRHSRMSVLIRVKTVSKDNQLMTKVAACREREMYNKCRGMIMLISINIYNYA